MNSTLTCAFAVWSPGLGDNNAGGWITVAAYLAAAGASVLAARALAGDEAGLRRERVFWWVSAAVLLFLAVNKQLDLQSLFTAIGRCHAQLTGWYGMRRTVQELFILVLAAGGLAGLGVMAWLLRGILGRVWPALIGLGFVCVFVLIRAASFHHVDELLGSSALGLKVNWLLELPGPLLVAAVALHRRKVGVATRAEALANQDRRV
ncbi:isopropylmalate isomerase [Tabrizicola sp.]|uniref:isopropylmalate isomerase n=1 Tax=Tabrizicola sp. TaxID=2005166 RepID=UPI003F367957